MLKPVPQSDTWQPLLLHWDCNLLDWSIALECFNFEVLQGTSDLQIRMTVANILKIRVVYLIWLKFS